jgi:polyhydroxybutyrate depolymerase
VIALASLAAGADGHAAVQTSDGSVVRGAVEVDGQRRTYRLFVPRLTAGERYAGTVVVLHGGGRGESGATIATSVAFDAEAAGRRLIAVYPDAHGGRFHAGHCCGVRPTRGDDVRFVVRLVGLVQRRYTVEARRTFATGFSNGAFLAYRLACQQAHRFAAVASVGGTEVLRRCRPARPVSVLHVHGRDDRRVRFEGGILGHPWTPGALELVRRWRVRDRCPPGRTRTQRSPQLLISRTSGCRRGTQVQLVVLASFAHAWPGADPPYGRPSIYDATSEIGGFFAGVR